MSTYEFEGKVCDVVMEDTSPNVWIIKVRITDAEQADFLARTWRRFRGAWAKMTLEPELWRPGKQ